MPDGKRKRRHCPNGVKRDWYAQYRAARFAQRFGGNSIVVRCRPLTEPLKAATLVSELHKQNS